jgi:hypothetical protein
MNHWQILALLLLGIFVGCNGPAEDPEITAQREKYLLSQEPDGAVDIAQAKLAAAEGKDIVLLGRINAGAHDPWTPGEASFILMDALDGHAAKAGHDAGDCRFCRERALKAPRAVIRIVDEQGKTVPIDARKLFGLKKDQTVVVRGRAKMNDAIAALEVRASGIYVKNE